MQRMDLDDYAYDRCEQFHQLGGVARDVVAADTGGEVIIQGNITFGDQGLCVLYIFEVVRLAGGTAHRHKYSYHLQCGDEFGFRYDRDPVGHPGMPEHKHVPPDQQRVSHPPVTLSDVMEKVWPAVMDWESRHPPAAESSPTVA